MTVTMVPSEDVMDVFDAGRSREIHIESYIGTMKPRNNSLLRSSHQIFTLAYKSVILHALIL